MTPNTPTPDDHSPNPLSPSSEAQPRPAADPTTLESATPPVTRPAPGRTRAGWHRRVSLVPLGYLLGIAVVAFVHPFLSEGVWLLVHLLLLGAVTNAIVIWSLHFTEAVLRSRSTTRRWEGTRLATLNAGILGVLAGGTAGLAWVAVAGACLVFVAVAAHLLALAARLRHALPARFSMTVHFYLVAGLALLVGIPLGAMMLVDHHAAWHSRVLLVHIHVNLFGWITMTVLGTLLTLWPTVLRTRIAEGAEAAAQRALWSGSVGLGLLGAGLLLWWPVLAVAGLVLLLAAGALIMVPGLRAAQRKSPASFASWSMAAAMGWLFVALVYDGVVLAGAGSAETAGEQMGGVLIPLLVGFVAQMLLGALSYLIPVVMGGGPSRTRETTAALDRHWAQRVTMTNATLILYVLPVPSYVRISISVLLLVALIQFLAPALRVLVASRRTVVTPPHPPAGPAPRRSS